MALEKPSSPASPPKVPSETIGKAVDALLKWIKSKPKSEKSPLFEHDDFLYLILTLKKIPPKGRTNPYKIPLPHPLHPFDSSEELCLIFDDRPKSSLSSETTKKKIQNDNIPISKVLKLSKLKSDYRPFEAKRKLCSSYDMFFADKRIIPLLPKLLGKEFFKRRKLPIPIELSHKNWREQIEVACQSALLFLRTGTCSVIKVGRISQSRDELIANVVAAIDGAAEIVPKKWGNVRSLHLKLTESLALPIYQTLPEIGLKIEGIKKLDEEGSKAESQAESGEEGLAGGKGKKKTSKKGRIHAVRYMDDTFGVSDDNNDDDRNVNDPLGKCKKRKKAVKLEKEKILKEVNGEKRLKKGEVAKPKKNNVFSKVKDGVQEIDDEMVDDKLISSDVKKKMVKKNKVGNTDGGGMKLKSKKSLKSKPL